MADRPINLGLGLFFVAFILSGVPATMPFSPLNTRDEETGVIELTRQNTLNTDTPATIVAYHDLDPTTQDVVAQVIEDRAAREPVANISLDDGLALRSTDHPAVVAVQYDGEYYELEAKLTTVGARTSVQDTRARFIRLLTTLGLFISLVGFVYYTEFGSPHARSPAILFASMGLALWLLVYVIPFHDLTEDIVETPYTPMLAGGLVFFGVHTWRYLSANVTQRPVTNDTDTQ